MPTDNTSLYSELPAKYNKAVRDIADQFNPRWSFEQAAAALEATAKALDLNVLEVLYPQKDSAAHDYSQLTGEAHRDLTGSVATLPQPVNVVNFTTRPTRTPAKVPLPEFSNFYDTDAFPLDQPLIFSDQYVNEQATVKLPVAEAAEDQVEEIVETREPFVDNDFDGAAELDILREAAASLDLPPEK